MKTKLAGALEQMCGGRIVKLFIYAIVDNEGIISGHRHLIFPPGKPGCVLQCRLSIYLFNP